MSRVRVQEVSSPISLFPFIGILICTMGALLVVLVAVSRSARDSAERDVQSHDPSGAKVAIAGTFKKIEEVKATIGNLNTVRGQAETKLRDEQLRLGGVEDHIRQLRERIAVLQSADAELKALEQEHYDDHQQAEREIDRLHKLIADSKKSVEVLQEAGKSSKKSYAVVPYEGPNGTFRRPIYIECTKSELIIQPEGIHISEDDVRPPLTPGNPLATVLRASREYLVKLNPQSGKSHDTEPYALLLVRPDGNLAYYAARQAIEIGDFDLGYELVEADWKIKYPEPDTQLAGIQAQALDQARARQQLLAAAAPRAYGNGTARSSGEFDDDGPVSAGGSGRGMRPGGGGRTGRASHDYIVHKSGNEDGDAEDIDNSISENGGDEVGSSAGGSGNGSAGPSTGWSPKGGMSSAPSSVSGSGTGQPGGGGPALSAPASGSGSPGGSAGNAGNGSPPAGSPPDKSLTPDGYQNGGTAVAGSPAMGESDPPPPDDARRREKERVMSPEKRGKDWALKQKPPRAVQVRRTIRVAVTKNQLTIAPDSGPANAGKVIPLPGDTVESVDEFVKQVRDHIDGWGIAGDNLYWRPVVVLNVGPDGQQRANDLNRLLKNSGLELRADETAKNPPQGARMKRVEVEADQMPGQDSFLDVITNIVGILILLVLVVGLRTTRSVHGGSGSQAAEQARADEQLRQVTSTAIGTEGNVRQLVYRVGNAQKEAEFREGERMWMTTFVAKAEQEIADRRAKLSTVGQRDFDMRQKLNAAQMELDELTRQQIALMSQDSMSEQLECQPTPIGKAVTGNEVYLMLSDDHVAILPKEELIKLVGDDINENIWRIKAQSHMIRTVGPVNGWRLKYYYGKEDVMRATDAGTYMLGSVGRCTECRFLPAKMPIGEPAADALKPNSELFQFLKGLRADGTTVTIWTYPGNYDRLRHLKQAIRELGYQIAVRPIPKGALIGSSSSGTKSLTE